MSLSMGSHCFVLFIVLTCVLRLKCLDQETCLCDTALNVIVTCIGQMFQPAGQIRPPALDVHVSQMNAAYMWGLVHHMPSMSIHDVWIWFSPPLTLRFSGLAETPNVYYHAFYSAV